MAKRADGPHLKAQPPQGSPGLRGIEVEDVEVRRTGEDLLDRVQLLVDLNGMLPNHAKGPVAHCAEDICFPQPDPLPAHDQVYVVGFWHPPFLVQSAYTNNNTNPTNSRAGALGNRSSGTAPARAGQPQAQCLCHGEVATVGGPGVTDEQEWVEHRVRTYYAGMDPRERAELDHRVVGAIGDDGARGERARRMVGLADCLRHHPHDSATEEEISTLFALSGPWSWQTICGADAEHAIDRLEAERGHSTDRGAAVASVRSMLGLTKETVRRRELDGAIEAATAAQGRAVTRRARERASARTDELCEQWAALAAETLTTQRRAVGPLERPHLWCGQTSLGQEAAP
jgi:hypothetical protein